MAALESSRSLLEAYFGIPCQPMPKAKEGQPQPSWRGFLYFSLGLSLLYIALDQGQRLDVRTGTMNPRLDMAFVPFMECQ